MFCFVGKSQEFGLVGKRQVFGLVGKRQEFGLVEKRQEFGLVGKRKRQLFGLVGPPTWQQHVTFKILCLVSVQNLMKSLVSKQNPFSYCKHTTQPLRHSAEW